MQVIFFSVPGLPAVFISSAPAAEEIGFSPVRERFICFHSSVCVQIVTVIVPGLPTRCNFSIFCQFPLSIHHDPLHVGYISITIKSVGASVDFGRSILICAAPAAQIADFPGIIQSPLIGAHTSIAVQVIFISIPGLPTGCNFSIFCQFPLSIHHDPLHVGYFCSTIEGIRTSIDFCRLALIGSAPAAEIADFSGIIQSPLIGAHTSIAVQVIFISIPGLPARCNFSVFYQIPFSTFYNPLGTLYLTVCTECIASAVDSCLAVQVSSTPAAEVINRSIRINHPLICFHGSVCIQIIFFSVPGLPAGLFYTVFVQIPGSGLLCPSGFSSCLYRNCWEHICCGRCAYCQAQAKKYHCDSFSHTFFLRPCQTLTPIFLLEFHANV